MSILVKSSRNKPKLSFKNERIKKKKKNERIKEVNKGYKENDDLTTNKEKCNTELSI